tara:strand:- start:746 stop:1810 length:1065 start_codon:yes stop_codon:yes gene_type:complete
MSENKNKNHQNIYNNLEQEQDIYNPQIEKNLINQREQDFKRKQIISNFLLSLSVIFIIILIIIITNYYISPVEKKSSFNNFSQEYIPRYTLDKESQWVLDLDKNFADLSNIDDEISFNFIWLKKAMFNMILAEKAYEVQKYEQALEYYLNAKKIIPNLNDLPIRIGMCYFQLKDYDNAIEVMKDVSLDELNNTTLNNLGAVLIDAKSYDLASNYLHQVIINDPLYANAFKNLAFLNKELGNDTKSINLYEKYLDLNPDDNQTRHFFALYLNKIGKYYLCEEQINILLNKITDDPSIYLLQFYNSKKIGKLDDANKAMIRASNLTGINNPIKWMNEKEFEDFKKEENFELKMINK